jgi:3-phenylpropionate/cinnamic acid dioxygenase small subunit
MPTMHLVGSVLITGVDGDQMLARANYAVCRTWHDAVAYGRTELSSVGEYRDRIVMTAGGARFAERTVAMDTSKIDSLPVTPI